MRVYQKARTTYTLVSRIGGAENGAPGGKAGVAITADGEYVIGSGTVSGPANGVNFFRNSSGTVPIGSYNWVYDGSIEPGTGIFADVAVDQQRDLLFGLRQEYYQAAIATFRLSTREQLTTSIVPVELPWQAYLDWYRGALDIDIETH